MPIAIQLQANIQPASSGTKTAVYCPAPLVPAWLPGAHDTGQCPSGQERNLQKEALASWERFKQKYRAELEALEDQPYHT